MSKENVVLFFKEMDKNKELSEKFSKISAEMDGKEEKEIALLCKTKLVPLAKEAGFEFSAIEYAEFCIEASVELNEEKDSVNMQALNLDELDSVSGGASKATKFVKENKETIQKYSGEVRKVGDSIFGKGSTGSKVVGTISVAVDTAAELWDIWG